jgi:hypothetical protein
MKQRTRHEETPNSTKRWSVRLFALSLLVFAPVPAMSLEPAEASEDSNATVATSAPTEIAPTAEASPSTLPQEDACDWTLAGQPVQEQSREVLRSWSCHSFRWFDSLWGDSEDFAEDEVRGWMTTGAEYTQYDGFDPRLRLRVRAPLPNMNLRWDLVLGRVDEESYVSDTEVSNEQLFDPRIQNRDDDEPEWLLGLGHRGKQTRSGWDWDAGVRLRTPPRPYVKLQYYWNKAFSLDTDFRYRQTLFWRGDDGFGTTGRADFSHRLDPSNVLRTEAIATHSESTFGTQWYFGQTWYHLFEGEKGLSLLAFVTGETEHEVPLREYGFNLLWRRPFTRDWLYLSYGPSVTWPKEFDYEEREVSFGFGVWIELEFGDWRY